ncbi:hypothetical protein [Helicobacter sp. 23-1045]
MFPSLRENERSEFSWQSILDSAFCFRHCEICPTFSSLRGDSTNRRSNPKRQKSIKLHKIYVIISPYKSKRNTKCHK